MTPTTPRDRPAPIPVRIRPACPRCGSDDFRASWPRINVVRCQDCGRSWEYAVRADGPGGETT